MTEHHSPRPDEISFPDTSELLAELPGQAAPEEQAAPPETEITAVEMDSRLKDAHAVVTAIKDQYPKSEAGQNSFYDVTGNLLGPALSNFRFWNEYKIPEDVDDDEREEIVADLFAARKDSSKQLLSLEAYLGAVQSNPKVLDGEINARDGAFPELRQQADVDQQEGRVPSAIIEYVDRLSRQAQEESVSAQATE